LREPAAGRPRGWRSGSTHCGLPLTVPCVGASRIRVLGSAPLRTGPLVFKTRTLRGNQTPRAPACEIGRFAGTSCRRRDSNPRHADYDLVPAFGVVCRCSAARA
jgi:hypothetical protein